MLSPTASRALVFAHASHARFHRFAAGPDRADVESIEPLCGCDLVIAAQTNTQVVAAMGKKTLWRTPGSCWMKKGTRHVGSR
ncbi:hypothetical protein TRIP_B10030 [uncultured Desulfatiglans sp.]|uniref:Uncharacterized protein n=1 Tax=Uncultured Desulfatiglans sp. TaxID=1748965 RepID=A0A653A0Y0_UNCDX|nr:hypothetical protein TRIP_B10030 [uncultured Desulfatiglans sp.]